jgi:hypothetical protein
LPSIHSRASNARRDEPGNDAVTVNRLARSALATSTMTSPAWVVVTTARLVVAPENPSPG